MIEAATKLPWAVTGGPLQAPEGLWTRAWVTQARLRRQGMARLHQVSVAPGLWDGPTLGGRDQHAGTLVVPAKAQRALTADARA